VAIFIKETGEGAPLILLHGWGFNHQIWQPLIDTLAARWRVYQVDLPGHGNSDECVYQLPVLIEVLTAQLPKNAHWVGWSLGGLLAMAVARWQPEYVQKLLLVSISPRFVTAPDWHHAMTPEVLQQFGDNLQQDTLGTLKRFLALQVLHSNVARQSLRELQHLLENSPLPQITTLTASLQLLFTADLRQELQYIQCPSLLCLGAKDVIVPVGVGTDCQALSNRLRKVIIKSAAHIPFLSHPTVFLSIMQGFLDESS
jgi:pimeloyl-[acyl-carrier protein] methyl ester esterase